MRPPMNGPGNVGFHARTYIGYKRHEEFAMSTVSYTDFRQHLAKYMDEVCDIHAALHVTR